MLTGHTLKSKEWKIILLSAETGAQLDRIAHEFTDYLKKNPGINLSDAAFTLQVARKHYKHRRILVSSGINETIDELTAPHSKKVHTHTGEDHHKPVIFMFAGQGSQYVNMCRELYLEQPPFRENVDKCLDILKSLLDDDIKDVLYPENNLKEAAEEMNRIEIAQLIIFIVEYALAKLLIKWGITPDAMIGYSLGEYIAACISGILSLEDALKLVVLRGKLILKTPPASMLSVPLTEEQIKPLLNKELSLAIVNGISCVVAGTSKAIDAFEKELQKKRIFPMRLNSSHAPHSLLMHSILEEFTEEVGKITLNTPKIPYIANVTGKWLTDREAVDPGFWATHLRHTVLFSEGLKTLSEKQNSIFIEIGPGRDLTILLKRYIDNNPKERIIDTIRHSKKNVSDVYFLLNKIARLWLLGINIDWEGFHQNRNGQLIKLPQW